MNREWGLQRAQLFSKLIRGLLEKSDFAPFLGLRRAGDYIQPGVLFRLMNESQKGKLFSNAAEGMSGVPEHIITRQLARFNKADPDCGNGVAGKLGMDMNKYRPWAALPLSELIERTSKNNFADGTSPGTMDI